MVTKLLKKGKILDKSYFIRKAFGVLKTDFGNKSSLSIC
ncbi:MAG: hypothetical protein KatS3mg096_084 [Candidatus Parcubacteria bacterium]|nr:MAG: hypothetical protein KatS3mg096_084 [Candidatus Parcubacteria bacterium]